MFDLSSALQHIPLEDIELPVDPEFIANFLRPYFPDIPAEELAAKVAEVISSGSFGTKAS